jgi:hypothetical protein
MNIELTREQFITLIECLHLGSHIRDDRETLELEQSLLKQASNDGFDNAVAATIDGYTLGPLLANGLHDEIDKYDDRAFWSSLAGELADKDLRLAKGEEAVKALSDEEYRLIHDDLADRYLDEFEAHGIDHVSLAHPLPLA